MVSRFGPGAGALLVLVGALLGASPGRADVSVTRVARPAEGPQGRAPNEVIRHGLRLRFEVSREKAGVRMRVWASSADGQPHRMPRDPLTVDGNLECPGSTGQGFGEGRGGSDGWAEARTVEPGPPVKLLDRLVDKLGRFGRPCTATYKLELEHLDGEVLPDKLVAEVVWTRPTRGPDSLVLLPRD